MDIITTADRSGEAGSRMLLNTLRLASPALPVGAYAYSQGLEYAVEAGWVADEAALGDWIQGLLAVSLSRLDGPLLLRMHSAWASGDVTALEDWNAWLCASRETSELLAEDVQLGRALARLLRDLGHQQAAPWCEAETSFASMFALAARLWGLDAASALGAYLWAWAENQVMVGVKLVPLGQTSAQRLLSGLLPHLQVAAETAAALADHELGGSAPGQTLASCWHETQYTRMFRS